MFALWSFPFGRLSSFLAPKKRKNGRRFRSRFFAGREEDERNAADGAERERERDPSSSSSFSLPFWLFQTRSRWHENWGRKNVEHKTRVLNTGTNDDVRFLSPFTKFSLRRSERKRERKEGLALARSFVRVTRVCDILKNILLDGRLTRQKM